MAPRRLSRFHPIVNGHRGVTVAANRNVPTSAPGPERADNGRELCVESVPETVESERIDAYDQSRLEQELGILSVVGRRLEVAHGAVILARQPRTRDDESVSRATREGFDDFSVGSPKRSGYSQFQSRTRPSTSCRRTGSLMHYVPNPTSGTDPRVLPRETKAPFVFLKTEANELWGQFSQDGRWVAYRSNETGRYEIYVRLFSSRGGGPIPISTAGGVYPRWSRDGKELYFIAPTRIDGRLDSTNGDAGRGRRPDAAFPDAPARWRGKRHWPQSSVRCQSRWPVPHQRRRRVHPATDHAPDELEAFSEACSFTASCSFVLFRRWRVAEISHSLARYGIVCGPCGSTQSVASGPAASARWTAPRQDPSTGSTVRRAELIR